MNRYIQLTADGKRQNSFGLKMKRNSYILRTIVKKSFKNQYRNSILGILWTVLHPLLNMAVMVLVFSQVFGRNSGVGSYPIYIMCGNVIFAVVRQITTSSMTSMVSQAGLVKKVRVSYSVFPVANMFNALINFGLSFVALVILMICLRQVFHWTTVLTLAILPALLLFSLGIGFGLACMYVFFRDVKHLFEIFLTLWTYLTPIFYTISSIKSATVTKIITLNPMTTFVTAFRDIIQWGTVPSLTQFLIMYGWAFLAIILGYGLFKLNQKKYILYI